MKRILIILLAIVIAVSCFAVPAFAAVIPPPGIDVFGYEFKDLFAGFNGSTNWLSGELRYDAVNPYYSVYRNGIFYTNGYGWHRLGVGVWNESYTYDINFWPLGLDPKSSSANSNLIRLSSLPSGAEFYFDFKCDVGAPVGTPEIKIMFSYYTFDRHYISQDYYIFSGLTVEDFYYTVRKPTDAEYVGISMQFKGFEPFEDYAYDYYFEFDWFDFLIYFAPEDNVAVLYDILKVQGDTNNIIEEIISKLSWLDDWIGVLDKPITPIKPGGTGDFNTDTDAVIDNSQAGLDYAGGLLDSIGGSLAQAATGFAALTALFNLFSVMPFFSLLLQLSVTIGLFGLMTGLIGSLVSKFSVRGKDD